MPEKQASEASGVPKSRNVRDNHTAGKGAAAAERPLPKPKSD
jgi:hypothetical protein